MKIAVCIKQVPVVSKLKFDNATRRLVRDGVPNEVNHFDMLAMSAVTALKEALSAEVVVYTMGPPQAREALVQCLAMGADRAVHVTDRAFAGSDTLATARALSMALSREEYDLVLCGRNSVDAETGQVGPEIAEFLGVPQITNVRRIEVDGAGGGLRVERLTDQGHDVVFGAYPLVVTVTEDVAPEIFPRREEVEAARAKSITEVSASDLSEDTSLFGVDGSPTWVSEIYSIEPDRGGVVVQDRPVDEAVDLLLEFLDRRRAFHGERTSSGVPRGPRREKSEKGAIWVVAEIFQGEVRPVTLELEGRAVELAGHLDTSVEAVVIGAGIRSHAPTLTAYGADRILLAEDPGLAQYDTETYATVLADAIRAHGPYALLIPSTINGRDLAARLAARLGLGLTGDCIGLEVDPEGRLVQLKPAFGGNVVAPILSKTMPQMTTLRPGILTPVTPDWSLEPEVLDLPTDNIPDPSVSVMESVADSSAEGAELEHARVIVTVGKGVGEPENIPQVRRLAEALGGALGATRIVTDMGWLPKQYQIGLSGKSVAPELYIAVGVRGAYNHMVGVQKAATIVAINSNPKASIFKAVDFGIVGDYAEVVPALIAALDARSADRGD